MSDEHLEQVNIFNWVNEELQRQPPRYSELALLFAVPNGGFRAKRTAALLKLEGVRPGVPDMWLPVARGGYHGLVIELKTQKGRVSPEQKKWLEMLTAQGWKAVVCRGAAEAVNTIRWYLNGAPEPLSTRPKPVENWSKIGV